MGSIPLGGCYFPFTDIGQVCWSGSSLEDHQQWTEASPSRYIHTITIAQRLGHGGYIQTLVSLASKVGEKSRLTRPDMLGLNLTATSACAP